MREEEEEEEEEEETEKEEAKQVRVSLRSIYFNFIQRTLRKGFIHTLQLLEK